ncbi:MFS transporter [Streptomyces sp. NBC_00440]|uniref:MFS transporter n=1 Tax=Streptomyces sp. NBC_00440 TaxID=2975741 RepID=UPI002E1BFD55
MSATEASTTLTAGIDGRTAVRLAVLAAATFVYVTFEVFPVGLMQEIAHSLDATPGRVGLLVTGYALVAAVVTIPTVALASRVSRSTALVASLAVLVGAELLAAAATGYTMMVVSRVAAALTHGVLWSLIAPAAATLVPRDRVGTATAAVFGGASLAAIVGSPGTTLIGGLIGWRATVLVLAAATVAVTLALVWALGPRTGGGAARKEGPAYDATASPARDATASPTGGTATVARGTATVREGGDASVNWRGVLILCGVALVLVTAHFLSYTYFAVIVTDVTGASRAMVTLLTVFGLAGAAATYLVGRYNDTVPQQTAAVTMAAFLAGVGLLALGFAPVPTAVRYTAVAVAVALWGGAFAAAGPVFQTGVMRLAARDADRASSVYVTVFQIGIACGSGSGAILLGVSTAWLPAVSTALALLTLAVVLLWRPVPAVGDER